MIWRNLGLIALFLIGCLLLSMLWLRLYTHHGQALVLPDYTDVPIQEARQDAKKNSFQIVVIDSAFIVGKDGGIIIDQNPPGESRVKQKRKIYVTVTKYLADQIPLRRLPIMYGKSFERKRRELKQGFEINAKIIGRKFDSGAPDHILEVVYDGETIVNADRRKDNTLIDKGGTLEMIVSKPTGASLSMPDLACKTIDEAVFLVRSLQLVVGEKNADETVLDEGSAFVWRQYPDPSSRVYTGDTVTLYLTREEPLDCPD